MFSISWQVNAVVAASRNTITAADGVNWTQTHPSIHPPINFAPHEINSWLVADEDDIVFVIIISNTKTGQSL